MKAILLKTPKGLRGATEDDHSAWLKFKLRLEAMKPGTWIRVEATSPRNGGHHRKFMALMHLITENSETYNTVAKATVAVKLIVGHFDAAIHPQTGELMQIPKSISYESMDQEHFDAFYSAAIDGVLQFILPQFDRETADRLMDVVIEGWG